MCTCSSAVQSAYILVHLVEPLVAQAHQLTMLRHKTAGDSSVALVLYPTALPSVPMTAYKRMDTVDLEEPLDLSTKTENEIKVINQQDQFNICLGV